MNNILREMMAQTNIEKQTDRQQKIAETAIKLFAEKGYANTSTSEIAQQAGVAEGTIFRHYKTKDQLLLSLIVPFIKESIPLMAENVIQDVMDQETGSFEDFLRRLLKNRLQFLKENKEIFQVVVKEVFYNDELKGELMPFFKEHIGGRVHKVIAMYKEKGELIDIPTHELLKILFTFFGGYMLSRFMILTEDPADEDAEIEQMIQVVMSGVGR